MASLSISPIAVTSNRLHAAAAQSRRSGRSESRKQVAMSVPNLFSVYLFGPTSLSVSGAMLEVTW